MTRRNRKYVLDTHIFIQGFREPAANDTLQQFHRVFAPFEACVTYDGPTALDPLAHPFQQDSVALNLERLYVPSIVAALIPTEASLLFDQYQTVTATTAMGREVTVPLEFSHPTKTITFTL